MEALHDYLHMLPREYPLNSAELPVSPACLSCIASQTSVPLFFRLSPTVFYCYEVVKETVFRYSLVDHKDENHVNIFIVCFSDESTDIAYVLLVKNGQDLYHVSISPFRKSYTLSYWTGLLFSPITGTRQTKFYEIIDHASDDVIQYSILCFLMSHSMVLPFPMIDFPKKFFSFFSE